MAQLSLRAWHLKASQKRESGREEERIDRHRAAAALLSLLHSPLFTLTKETTQPTKMTTGILHDQNLEKQIERQMGCMTGFLQIFDRNQILNGKRLYTTKRLPPYPAMDSSSQSSSTGSPAFSGELPPPPQPKPSDSRPPPPERAPPTKDPARASNPVPVFEFKEGLRSSWKYKEAPRLSLDSRATVDGRGSLYPKEIRRNEAKNGEENDKQKRSPSVIARLMGLEALPDSGREPVKKVELRRSASESRVSKDFRFENSLDLKKKNENNVLVSDQRMRARTPPPPEYPTKSNFEAHKAQHLSSWKPPQQHYHQPSKNYFDTQDFFPEPKQSETLYGEIEKRLKLRGIDEPAKDLETLKQILEALQLKGLLHSKKPEENVNNSRSNFVFDRRARAHESPIVVMKPTRSQASGNHTGRGGVESSPVRKPKQVNNRASETSPPVRRGLINNVQSERNARNAKRNEQGVDKSLSSPVRRQVPNNENRRRSYPLEQPRSPVVNSPKTINSKKNGADQTRSKLAKNGRPMAGISPKERTYSPMDDEPSSISESSRSSSSQFDYEGLKMEDHKEGRSLLERCDKLLHSIAEITAPTELQPSPVSVLDSSFYKEESSPSPVLKRCISFRDQPVELEAEDMDIISPARLESNDPDFVYVSEILKASDCISDEKDVFWLLEKHIYRTNSSNSSRLHRKLVFDIITEILDKRTQLSPWKAFSSTKCTTPASNLQQTWLEFQRIREKDPAEDLLEIIGGVLKKDMAGDSLNGWGDASLETSEAVLDIERLIFKDLIVETIQDLATFCARNRSPLLRRKLVF